jgi:ATP-dependent Lon protease
MDTIPKPLLDRMEVIQLPGYIMEEKLEIAKRFLIPNQMKEHGLTKQEVNINKGAIEDTVDKYAREAGVRNLEKNIRKIMRKTTLRIAEGDVNKVSITKKNLEDFLGQPIFITEELYQRSVPGVTLGLAWTSMGGATLYIEATGISNKEKGFRLTGQLGSVMKESAEIAHSYVRSYLNKEKDCSEEERSYFDKNTVHLHVPAGATPKDGPSAGITMALALYSLAKGKAVRKDVAMTGELTLTGKVLPIGGIREKTIAARRVGIFDLIIPKDNRKDYERLPDYIKEGVKVHFVDYFEDVIRAAFD